MTKHPPSGDQAHVPQPTGGADHLPPAAPSSQHRDPRQPIGQAALVITSGQCILLALLVSLVVWGTLEVIMPVFRLSDELENLVGNSVTEEQFQEQRTGSASVRAKNATLAVVLLAASMALALTAAELLFRGQRVRAVWGGVFAGLAAAMIAIGAGTVGTALLGCLNLPDHRLVKTLVVQSGMLGVTGLAIGLGVSFALFRERLWVTCTAGCLLGGLLAGLLFPIVASVLLPDVNTEFLLPAGGIGRLLWVGLTAVLIGTTVTGLGKERSKPRRQEDVS